MSPNSAAAGLVLQRWSRERLSAVTACWSIEFAEPFDQLPPDVMATAMNYD